MSSVQASAAIPQPPHRAPRSAKLVEKADPHAAEMAMARQMLKEDRKKAEPAMKPRAQSVIDLTLASVRRKLDRTLAQLDVIRDGGEHEHRSDMWRALTVASDELERIKAKKYATGDDFLFDLWQVAAIVKCVRVTYGAANDEIAHNLEYLDSVFTVMSEAVELAECEVAA